LNGSKQGFILRKLIHLAFSLLLYFGTYLLEKSFFTIILFVCFLSVSFWEFLRLKKSPFLPRFLRISSVLKRKEEDSLSDAWYYVLGILFASFMLWDVWLRALILILGISDTLAYFVGKGLNGPRLFGQKTIYGSSSFFFSSLIILYAMGLPNLVGIFQTILCALLLTLSEVFFERDNLSIPIVYTLWVKLFW